MKDITSKRPRLRNNTVDLDNKEIGCNETLSIAKFLKDVFFNLLYDDMRISVITEEK